MCLQLPEQGWLSYCRMALLLKYSVQQMLAVKHGLPTQLALSLAWKRCTFVSLVLLEAVYAKLAAPACWSTSSALNTPVSVSEHALCKSSCKTLNTPCSELTEQWLTFTWLPAVLGSTPLVFLPVSATSSLHLQATKAVKGTLNKLTPEKFERLLQQLVDVVTSAEILHTTISLVFESAVAQPTFVAMYADLCDRLSKVCFLVECSISRMQVDKRWSCKVQGRQPLKTQGCYRRRAFNVSSLMLH
jgi:hypothetical protein